ETRRGCGASGPYLRGDQRLVELPTALGPAEDRHREGMERGCIGRRCWLGPDRASADLHGPPATARRGAAHRSPRDRDGHEEEPQTMLPIVHGYSWRPRREVLDAIGPFTYASTGFGGRCRGGQESKAVQGRRRQRVWFAGHRNGGAGCRRQGTVAQPSRAS